MPTECPNCHCYTVKYHDCEEELRLKAERGKSSTSPIIGLKRNYFEVTYTCQVPTTCRELTPEMRKLLENEPNTWIDYVTKAECRFIPQNDQADASP